MKYFFKKRTVLAVLFSSIFYVMLTACNQQSNKAQHVIAPLENIAVEPDGHYKTLSEHSPEPDIKRANLDAVSFPDKAHQLTIKVISPAYLSRNEIDALTTQLQPPANSSKQTRAELDFLLDLQANRTPEQVKEALRMHEIIYVPLIGMRNEEHLFFEAYEIFNTPTAPFNPAAYPKTKQLLHNVMKEMRIAEFRAKNHFLRARPRQLEPKLQPLKKMKSASYASGHTLWAYMQAYVFAALIPEKRNEFLDLAYQIGFSREVLGVHYPSDEEASRKLAHQLLKQMWAKPNFINDFHAAQLEWQKWD